MCSTCHCRYGTAGNFSLYKEDYIKLYVDTIKPVLFENDETRPYVISSPSNGIQSEEEGYVASNPYSALYGDGENKFIFLNTISWFNYYEGNFFFFLVHYYNYIFDGWTDYAYPDTRFASEYGFQSMPSFQSISKVSLPGDRNLQSNFTKKRQHLPLGNTYMMNLIAQQLPLPKDDGSEEYYKTFIYYSQVR